MKSLKNNVSEMYVIKRNNKKEIISFDKILKRIKTLGKEFKLNNIIYCLECNLQRRRKNSDKFLFTKKIETNQIIIKKVL